MRWPKPPARSDVDQSATTNWRTPIARAQTPPARPQLEGIPKVADTVQGLFREALASAGLPPSTRLASVGVCSSGFLQPGPQEELKAALRERAPGLADSYLVENDGPGTLYTATGAAGGMVLIAGTGSMAQYMDGSGRTHNCGGWGHLFGDGSCAHAVSDALRVRVDPPPLY